MPLPFVIRLLPLVLLLAVAILSVPVAAAAEQVAALRLQAEVATEASCMVPPDGEQMAPVARLDGDRAAKAEFCRCFAAAIARNAPPADQEDLIENQGVPPRSVARAAVRRCLGVSSGR